MSAKRRCIVEKAPSSGVFAPIAFSATKRKNIIGTGAHHGNIVPKMSVATKPGEHELTLSLGCSLATSIVYEQRSAFDRP